MPPEWMWHLDDELNEWFEYLKAKQDRPEESDDREEVPMVGNEYSDRFK